MSEYIHIPKSERENVAKLISALERAGKEIGINVEAEVVGGVLDKPWPRKDIDITVKIGKRGVGENELDRAKDEFKTLSNLVNIAIAVDSSFKINEEMEPAMDEEFGSPNILKFDGVIRVKPDNGTIIELIRKKHE